MKIDWKMVLLLSMFFSLKNVSDMNVTDEKVLQSGKDTVEKYL